jgi:ATP-dependent DNA helicase RecQ
MDTFTTEARERLRTLTGDPSAEFRDDQLEAIVDVVADHGRVLCVQRTGWGKSAVYFVATSLLRAPPPAAAGGATDPSDRGPAGPTLIISPLLALMRNQLAAAARLGLRAHTVNSTNREDWDSVADALAADTLDLLLISPERLNNPRFRDQMLPLFARSVGLLVIDEAHCISDWGHDFRPDYRRVQDMLAALGGRDPVPVLATTATANDRVVADVSEQLSAGPAAADGSSDRAPLRTYRGPLARTSLRLEVVELPRPAQRLAWLVEHLPSFAGSGIVYTLTKRDSEQVAEFLSANGIPALAYSGDQDSDARVAIEERLLANDIKAVVATSALGMGYDKPDLAFVVHYQAPGSVVAYYQQVGRAGRGVDHADVVLLRGGEDRRIQDFFIEQSFPSRERVALVLEELDAAAPPGRTTRELMATVNLGMGRLEAMLKILDVEGAVRRDGSRWQRVPDSGWSYDGERYEHVTALRRAEQEAMARYGADGRCLMRALQQELDDPGAAESEVCGRCAVCTAARYGDPPDPRLVELAGRHLRARPIELEVKKMAPDGAGTMRKIAEPARTEPGWALARFGDGGWWPAIERGLRSGEFDAEVLDALADLVRARVPSAAWVTAVPSARLGDTVERLADRLAASLGIERLGVLSRTEPRPSQREMENAAQQAANVRGAFRVTGAAPRGTGLLLDDRRSSGWTLAMVGGQLRLAGAERVVPLALGTLG